ncbi:allatostatin-A receptor-like [Paramacrobiotus metropolitanus]|uniref:allatostatin-A receptor-like n=1 Tax=Paramacrobiotus metropolitanus TaxID=2943436 RepID=UPI002445E9FB|nr:allatostatin-A receptor-like [Paramacrobiotus metropolitanus]
MHKMHHLYNISVHLNHSSRFASTPYELILTGFLGFSIIATVLLNGLIIAVYLQNPLLRNSFKTYIVNLSIAEVLLALTGMTGNFISAVFGYWPLPDAVCTFVLYGSRIFGSGIRYGHVIITLNRLWAVMYPLHYKRHHTLMVANASIVVSWVLAHAVHLPVIIPGRMWLLEGEERCVLNVGFQKRAAIAVEVMGFTAAEGVIICLCPVVWYKVRQWRINQERQQKQMPLNAARPQEISKSKDDNESIIDQDSRMTANGPTDTLVSLSPKRSAPAGNHMILTTTAIRKPSPDDMAKLRLTFSKRSVAHNRLLMYFFVAILLCWTPNNVYWLLVDTAGYWNGTFNIIQAVALYAHSWINPIISYIALEKIRVSINKLMGC